MQPKLVPQAQSLCRFDSLTVALKNVPHACAFLQQLRTQTDVDCEYGHVVIFYAVVVKLVTLLQISTCGDLTSNSCEVKVNGTASLVGVQQKSATTYKVRLQVLPLCCAYLSRLGVRQLAYMK